MTGIPATIFRQYDIRGIVERDLTPAVARAIGRAFAVYAQQRNVRGTVAVGRDNRPSGSGLRDGLVEGLTTAGMDVVDIGVVPTPLLYWTLHHENVIGGIQITGSHNPPEYNGFKLSFGKESLHGDAIQELRKLTEASGSGGGGKVREVKVIDRYLDDVIQRIGKLKRPMKVVYDCG